MGEAELMCDKDKSGFVFSLCLAHSKSKKKKTNQKDLATLKEVLHEIQMCFLTSNTEKNAGKWLKFYQVK